MPARFRYWLSFSAIMLTALTLSASFPLTAAAAVLLIAALSAFMVVILPANLTMRQWPLDAIPADWTRLRDRWEYTHGLRALLVLGALSALVVSVMRGRLSSS